MLGAPPSCPARARCTPSARASSTRRAGRWSTARCVGGDGMDGFVPVPGLDRPSLQGTYRSGHTTLTTYTHTRAHRSPSSRPSSAAPPTWGLAPCPSSASSSPVSASLWRRYAAKFCSSSCCMCTHISSCGCRAFGSLRSCIGSYVHLHTLYDTPATVRRWDDVVQRRGEHGPDLRPELRDAGGPHPGHPGRGGLPRL